MMPHNEGTERLSGEPIETTFDDMGPIPSGFHVYEVDDGNILVSPTGRIVAFNCAGRDTTYRTLMSLEERSAFLNFTASKGTLDDWYDESVVDTLGYLDDLIAESQA